MDWLLISRQLELIACIGKMPRTGSYKSDGAVRPVTKGKRNEKARKLDDDYDHVFQLAVNQEEQGERYQFGAKAKRSFEGSIESYQLSIQILRNSPTASSPADFFQSHFNLARVLIHYGTTFARARSDCVQFVEDGIDQYRQAISFASNNSIQSDEIDARYNLGLGLSTLAEMLSAGAVGKFNSPSNDCNNAATQLWKSAKEELLQAYKLQERLLADSRNLDEQQPQKMEDGGDVHQSVGCLNSSNPAFLADNQTTLVEEFFITTPSVVIDTLIDICEVLLSIHSSEPDLASIELGHYFQQLEALNQVIEASNSPNFNRRFEIDNLVCNAHMTMIEHKLCDCVTSEDPTIVLELEQQLISVSQKLEELSQQSTTLNQDFFCLIGLTNNLSTLCSNICSLSIIKAKITNTPIPELEINQLNSVILKTLNYHSRILHQLNQYKLNPIKQIKSYEVSYYVTSSLNGQSELHLIQELLQQQQQPSEPNITDIGRATASFDLAIEAYNQSLGPYKITKQITTNSLLRLEFVRIHQPGSTSIDLRNEWANFSVRLDSIKLILRSKFNHLLMVTNFRISSNHTELENLAKFEILPLVRKFEITKFDLMRYLDDFLYDPVFLLTDSIENNLFNILLADIDQDGP